SSVGQAWDPWEQAGGTGDTANELAVATDSAGLLQVARTAPDGNVYVARQLISGWYLGPWVKLPEPPQVGGQISYGADGIGGLHLFMIGADSRLYHSAQEATGATWSSWNPVGNGTLLYQASQGVVLTEAFPTQEVYGFSTVTHWDGSLNVFAR